LYYVLIGLFGYQANPLLGLPGYQATGQLGLFGYQALPVGVLAHIGYFCHHIQDVLAENNFQKIETFTALPDIYIKSNKFKHGRNDNEAGQF